MKIPKKWFTLWLTWLSWSWKSTISDKVLEILKLEGYVNITQLDWDILRSIITKDLWFSREDRIENISRVWYISWLLSENWVWVIATFISPYYEMRKKLRDNIKNFIEVFVDTPIEICEKRDVKWLYKKARNWEIKDFTWISDIYDIPNTPDLIIKWYGIKPKDWAIEIINFLKKNNFI